MCGQRAVVMLRGTLLKIVECIFQWAEMLEKEFASVLAINSELEASKKATAESLLKTTSTVYMLHQNSSSIYCCIFINRLRHVLPYKNAMCHCQS